MAYLGGELLPVDGIARSSRSRWSLPISFPRRQQCRRLWRGTCSAGLAVVLGVVGLVVASAGAPSAGGLSALTATAAGLYARHWFSLARRSQIGAESEDLVRQELARLRREGWRVRHSVRWQGGGDIDSVALAPTGGVVAIETKTRGYGVRHLARVRAQAEWLARSRG